MAAGNPRIFSGNRRKDFEKTGHDSKNSLCRRWMVSSVHAVTFSRPSSPRLISLSAQRFRDVSDHFAINSYATTGSRWETVLNVSLKGTKRCG